MVASSPGEAIANGRQIGSGWSGMCQKYVRDACWETPSLYGSAIDAWNGSRQKHPGDRSPPKGAPVYWRGGSYGHAAIFVGGGNIRSTDCTSGGDISEVSLSWIENSWGYTYLGWTGDINGVDLPLGGDNGNEDDMPLNEDDLSAIAKRVNQVLGDFTAAGDKRDPSEKEPEQANARLAQIENVVRNIADKVDDLAKKL